MMFAAIVRELISAGLNGDDLVAAIERIEASCPRNSADIADTSADRRRAKDRERKRLVRGHSAEICGLPRKSAVRLLIEERKIDLKEEEKKESKIRRAQRLSADWQPTETDRQFSIGKGMSNARVNTEAEKFRNYWTARGDRGAAKLDWAATWRNWCLQSLERVPPEIPPEIGKPKTDADWGWRPGMRTSAEIIAEMEAKNGNRLSAPSEGIRIEGPGLLQNGNGQKFPGH